jgi:hypothetical protein
MKGRLEIVNDVRPASTVGLTTARARFTPESHRKGASQPAASATQAVAKTNARHTARASAPGTAPTVEVGGQVSSPHDKRRCAVWSFCGRVKSASAEGLLMLRPATEYAHARRAYAPAGLAIVGSGSRSAVDLERNPRRNGGRTPRARFARRSPIGGSRPWQFARRSPTAGSAEGGSA